MATGGEQRLAAVLATAYSRTQIETAAEQWLTAGRGWAAAAGRAALAAVETPRVRPHADRGSGRRRVSPAAVGGARRQQGSPVKATAAWVPLKTMAASCFILGRNPN